MVPSVGRIVHYRLTEIDAASITKRRAVLLDAVQQTGTVVEAGNAVREGDVYPLVITRVWADNPTEGTAVNGQVLLDGNDTLWVTSRIQGDDLGRWSDPREAILRG